MVTCPVRDVLMQANRRMDTKEIGFLFPPWKGTQKLT